MQKKMHKKDTHDKNTGIALKYCYKLFLLSED